MADSPAHNVMSPTTSLVSLSLCRDINKKALHVPYHLHMDVFSVCFTGHALEALYSCVFLCVLLAASSPDAMDLVAWQCSPWCNNYSKLVSSHSYQVPNPCQEPPGGSVLVIHLYQAWLQSCMCGLHLDSCCMECVALLIKHWYCRHPTGQFEWSLMSLLMEIITLPANNDIVKSY